MFEFPFKPSGLISIDIGAKNIKVIEIEIGKNDGAFVKKFDIVATPKDCINNGLVHDTERMGEAIKKVILENDMRVKKVKLVISGSHIISRVILVDVRQERKIDILVKEAIDENLPMINVDTHFIDFKIVKAYNESSGQKLKIWVTAVSKSIINSYREVIDGVNLKPISIGVHSESISKFFKRNILEAKATESQSQSMGNKKSEQEFIQETIAIIDFGSETTELSVLKNRTLEFNKVILKGSSKIDDDIAKATKMKLFEAELQKKKQGLLMPDEYNRTEFKIIQEIIKRNTDEIIQQIHQLMEFYKRRCYGSNIDKIYIIGGGAYLKGLTEYLEGQLNIPVLRVNLRDVSGIKINKGLDLERSNLLINAVGTSL